MGIPDFTAIYRRESPDPAVMVADGENMKVTVRNGALSITDGTSPNVRVRTIPRIPRKVARLVILGHHGYITLEAFRWLADQRITVSQLDQDARIMFTSPGQQGNCRLRRAQAYAAPGGPLEGTGVAIAGYLIRTKLAGQADTLRLAGLNSCNQSEKIMSCRDQITEMRSLDDIMLLEAKAAQYYWSAWRHSVHVPYSPHDMLWLPSHWALYQNRESPLSPNARNAVDPINAMLNYVYSLAESEARSACHIAGLDPGLGVLHGEGDSRIDHDVMVLDLMEVIRPVADMIVLDILRSHDPAITGKPDYFKSEWTYETRDGMCRLFPPLTHMLAERILELARDIAPHAEHVTRLLANASYVSITAPKPFTTDLRIRAKTPAEYNRIRRAWNPLSPTLTEFDLVPGTVWLRVLPLLPERSVRLKKARPRADYRKILAGFVAAEIHGVPWSKIPPAIEISHRTCITRIAEWKRLGVWDMIAGELREAITTRPNP